jgi:DNA end-binding protein Ku
VPHRRQPACGWFPGAWELPRQPRGIGIMSAEHSRPHWKGAISFGLVSIPVSLFSAVRREELKFHLLRASDQSPVKYKRVAEADGNEVPWDQIVKGYEYEKGKFVVLNDEDFKRADVEATQTVEILNFVELEKINPLLFYKPFYVEVGKGGDKAYALLRDALIESGKIGIAKVVIKTRQHLAAIKPQKKQLMLELMYFPEEVLDIAEFNAPAERMASKAELNMAKQLIESMSTEWEPGAYKDEYKQILEQVIEQKVAHGGKAQPPTARKAKPANVVDLVSVLQESIKATRAHGRAKTRKAA